ncbi:MAG: glycosyltransferase family 2 protein [bacterium]|nr:glycosyltransferase family 2 protein [bacterium]
MRHPKISVILINYNNTPLTLACVTSLEANHYPNLKIHIVDNGSSLTHQQQLRSIKRRFHGLIKIASLGYNAGFTKANNVGMKQTLKENTDYLWILNNDTEVAKNAISTFLKTFTQFNLDRENSIASSIITMYGTGKIWCNGMYDLPMFNFPKSRHKQREAASISKTALHIDRVEYSVGCSMFFHKDFVKKHGMMDERYFIYYDDMDFSYKKKNYFIQKPLVYHKVSATSGIMGSDIFTPFQAYLHGKNAILFYFYKKRIPFYEKLIFLGLTVWVIIAMYVRSWNSLAAYCKGIRDGLVSKNKLL